MEMLCIGFLMGAVSTLIILLLVRIKENGGSDQGQPDNADNTRDSILIGDRSRSGDNGRDIQIFHTEEEMIEVLQVVRLSASRYEREVLDEIISLVERGRDEK